MYKASWSIGKHELELAVKTLKGGASEEDKVKFLQEAVIMGQFSHTNVIKMYGVVTVGDPVSDFRIIYAVGRVIIHILQWIKPKSFVSRQGCT